MTTHRADTDSFNAGSAAQGAFATYLVGGAVRDALLGIEGSDRDWVVVGATPEAMLGNGFTPVGKDFPVFLHPRTKEEYALARTERKSGTGYKGFTVYATPDVTLEEDLQRRDLTINAIAQDTDGNLIDPWGGVRDLQNRVLRHVSAAFAEDPLRVLRVARFAARFADQGFTIADETRALMHTMSSSGELKDLVAERVWREFDKALQENQAQVFITVLHECGALATLLPEVDRLFGVPQPEQWHPEIDTGIHTLMSLQQACRLSNDLAVRFAALMHDVGKGLTSAEDWPQHIAHEHKGVQLIADVCQRLRVPTDCADLARLSSQYHTHCHQMQVLKPATVLKTLEGLDAFRRPQRLQKFLQVCEADARGRTGLEAQAYPQANLLWQCFVAADEIDVPTLLAHKPVPPGPEAGEKIRNMLHQARLGRIKDTLTRLRAAP
ncbi:multifunctional CCA addition/repair protein [Pseudohongiella sp.]|uniref:HD domain-containing protein n=1 Tax=marine sediment metagenome TaxID=412755 RepID=A0A0F9YQ75_9ZZZZ|nr:multifunctional CCA addition/repair protein [Pseudohongiella sp.]HDZ10010.1 multifunctional CCA addition/repair protein [Pseudohongiella sp.]HEA63906.1 multifunctional CCA addition/repair protein [Pseudohongiella sp.]